MAGGYMGKLLYVNLANGKVEEQALEEEICRKFLGGYGLGARILYDRMKPGVDPMGPKNILGFLTGPLTGTPALIGSRYVVVCKSPLTHTWGDANSGGFFGPALKFAGYDGVFFSGISEKPVYLFINEGKAELRDASKLWGKDSNETDDLLKAEHGSDIRLNCIGPAGEKLSLISCVMNDKGRAAGRSGVGAVMGSKRLKAVVAKGKLEVPIADADRTNELRRKYIREMEGFGPVLQQYGTSGITADSAMSGDSPVKNWAGAGPVDFPNAKAISDEAVIAHQERKFACWRCPIACGGHMKATTGPFAVPAGVHKPEYETLCTFGTLCLNDNLESIIKANDICNRAGLDTISAGCVIAFAIECYENGIITKEDTDGIELKWGDAEGIIAMTEKVAKREGLGDILADGVKVASEKIGKGSEEYAIHIGGEEVPMHDPKFTPGLAPTYQIDATPGRHTQGGELVAPPSGVEIGEHELTVYTGRAEDQKKLVDLMHVVNAAGICMFGHISFNANSIPEFLSSVTGWNMTMDDVMLLGERIGTIRHLFNLREGINPLKTKFPGRVLGIPPLKAGNMKDITVDADTFIKEYLELVDWDVETTRPSEERLKMLGLDDLG
ncbi:MAG: aldehyde ferredoxin oxidoreductase family protein [Candidatus Poribacteria bacterium]